MPKLNVLWWNSAFFLLILLMEDSSFLQQPRDVSEDSYPCASTPVSRQSDIMYSFSAWHLQGVKFFCGKEELNEGKMRETGGFTKIHIYRIGMLAILRHHPANGVTLSVNGCLFSRQIGEGGSWRAQEMWLPGRKGDAETRTGLEKINAEVRVNRTKHRNF